MAPPGWPDLAFSTIDAERIRILSAALFINALSFIRKKVIRRLLLSVMPDKPYLHLLKTVELLQRYHFFNIPHFLVADMFCISLSCASIKDLIANFTSCMGHSRR